MELVVASHNCEGRQAGTTCTLTGKIYIKPTIAGRQDIRVLVDYAG
jgi:hypothetical protein